MFMLSLLALSGCVVTPNCPAGYDLHGIYCVPEEQVPEGYTSPGDEAPADPVDQTADESSGSDGPPVVDETPDPVPYNPPEDEGSGTSEDAEGSGSDPASETASLPFENVYDFLSFDIQVYCDGNAAAGEVRNAWAVASWASRDYPEELRGWVSYAKTGAEFPALEIHRERRAIFAYLSNSDSNRYITVVREFEEMDLGCVNFSNLVHDAYPDRDLPEWQDYTFMLEFYAPTGYRGCLVWGNAPGYYLKDYPWCQVSEEPLFKGDVRPANMQ